MSNKKDGTYYSRNKAKEYRRVKTGRAERTSKFYDLKKMFVCVECGESHIACLDFHHTDPSNKLFTISQNNVRDMAWEKVMSEMSKCVVLCANCHRKLHYGQKNTTSNPC